MHRLDNYNVKCVTSVTTKMYQVSSVVSLVLLEDSHLGRGPLYAVHVSLVHQVLLLELALVSGVLLVRTVMPLQLFAVFALRVHSMQVLVDPSVTLVQQVTMHLAVEPLYALFVLQVNIHLL